MAKKKTKQAAGTNDAPPQPKNPNPPPTRKKPQGSEKPENVPQPGVQPLSTAPPGKAKKKPPKPKGETRTHRMFPELHSAVADFVYPSVLDPWFQEKNTERNHTNKWPTNIMGKFKCENLACKTDGWSSKKIATVIRGYPGNGYNAVVYNQRCRSCNKLGTLELKEATYVERVAYWLKTWAGVHVERPKFPSKTSPPHREDLCEGCKLGVCPQVMQRRRNSLESGVFWDD